MVLGTVLAKRPALGSFRNWYSRYAGDTVQFPSFSQNATAGRELGVVTQIDTDAREIPLKPDGEHGGFGVARSQGHVPRITPG
jgi:hypothetical protein